MSKEIVKHTATIVGFVVFLTMGLLILHRVNTIDNTLHDERDIQIRLLTFTNEASAKQYIGFQLSFIKYNQRTMYSYDHSTNTCTIVQLKNIGYENVYVPNYDVVDSVVKECFLLQQVRIYSK